MDTNCAPVQYEAAASEPKLTPSEVVYLAGEQFATHFGFLAGTYRTPSGVSVPTDEMAKQAYAAAFLAADKARMLHLEICSHKGLFGLGKVEVLCADPGNGTSPYPPASLEGQLLLLAANLYENKGQAQVWRVVYDLFPADSGDPYAMANNLIRSFLAERGLVEVTRTKKWMGAIDTEVRLPLRTEDMAASRVNEVLRLLHECQEEQPAMWELLGNGISQGLRARKPPQDPPSFW